MDLEERRGEKERVEEVGLHGDTQCFFGTHQIMFQKFQKLKKKKKQY